MDPNIEAIEAVIGALSGLKNSESVIPAVVNEFGLEALISGIREDNSDDDIIEELDSEDIEEAYFRRSSCENSVERIVEEYGIDNVLEHLDLSDIAEFIADNVKSLYDEDLEMLQKALKQ